MKLTKEECIKALDEIWFEANNGAIMCGDEISEEYNEILTQLIEEHFSSSSSRVGTRENPPLKFEEMKEWIGQPVWDNKERRYRILEFVNSQWVTFRETLDHTISEGFKENRFYRREVKE